MKHLIFAFLAIASASIVFAQVPSTETTADDLSSFIERADSIALADTAFVASDSLLIDSILGDSVFVDSVAIDTVRISVCDSLLMAYEYDELDLFAQPLALPDVFFMPAIYDSYDFFTPLKVGDNKHTGDEAMRWLEDYEVQSLQMRSLHHDLFYNHPELVRYNLSMLPEAPKQFQATVNPADFSITTVELKPEPTQPTMDVAKIGRRHWIREFTASLQFSQAYVSPNWYKGGTNNVNALGHLYYYVKLNQEYHPNLLFETTTQYKLGINNAPDDEYRSYNVSEDLFQVNTTFGLKAANRWYYSLTGQFKTQLVNSYNSNSNDLKSAFFAPGDLTLGVGMTYNYANKPKKLTFDASIAPLSYNLVMCFNDKINKGNFGIDEGKNTKSKFGSTYDLKATWQITYNISLRSRLFAFTDYESFQADWENTLQFVINQFLTTQIFMHARYDSATAKDADSDWRNFQLKELFSIGFTYKFATI